MENRTLHVSFDMFLRTYLRMHDCRAMEVSVGGGDAFPPPRQNWAAGGVWE